MSDSYILSVDQSTQGTKALLFDGAGRLIHRADVPHRQLINDAGWVGHDLNEIYRNTIAAAEKVIRDADIDPADIAGLGITNQRETAAAWLRSDGSPVCEAVVWQCARAASICDRIEQDGYAQEVKDITGIPLSPYFSAGKMAWILRNIPAAKQAADTGNLCLGPIDSYLIFRLTKGATFATDYSNASRTQVFDIRSLTFSDRICEIFDIPKSCLPAVYDSNAGYGMTDLEGVLPRPIPIHASMGDSHSALFGQGCIQTGMAKATHGTGSSVMMNVGEAPVISRSGLASSIAFCMDGKVNYCLEGNINYTGAVITWLSGDLGLFASPGESEALARLANPNDTTYLVPAFTGLGAPYWDSDARGILCGLTRTTGKAEIVRAGLDCIAYQIGDIVEAMRTETGIQNIELRVDGGPTKNAYLMQFESNVLNAPVLVPKDDELSGIGAAYAAGIALGLYDRDTLFAQASYQRYLPVADDAWRAGKIGGWKQAVGMIHKSVK